MTRRTATMSPRGTRALWATVAVAFLVVAIAGFVQIRQLVDYYQANDQNASAQLQESGYIEGDKVALELDGSKIRPQAWNLGDELTVFVLDDTIVAVQVTVVMCESPRGLNVTDTIGVTSGAAMSVDDAVIAQYGGDAVTITHNGIPYTIGCEER